jgi:hypothetical protein
MEQYAGSFVEAGITDMAAVAKLTAADVVRMGVTDPEHCTHLLGEIRVVASKPEPAGDAVIARASSVTFGMQKPPASLPLEPEPEAEAELEPAPRPTAELGANANAKPDTRILRVETGPMPRTAAGRAEGRPRRVTEGEDEGPDGEDDVSTDEDANGRQPEIIARDHSTSGELSPRSAALERAPRPPVASRNGEIPSLVRSPSGGFTIEDFPEGEGRAEAGEFLSRVDGVPQAHAAASEELAAHEELAGMKLSELYVRASSLGVSIGDTDCAFEDGEPRARSRYRFGVPLIHCIPDSLT